MDKLNILLIEDSPVDEMLILGELRDGGVEFSWQRVETEAALRAALAGQSWDAVICDYRLPALGAPEALRIIQEGGLDVPFIVVSGFIEEESAIGIMRSGARDFVTKEKLARLIPAIEREVKEARRRQQHSQVMEAARASETMLRNIALALGEGILVMDPEGRLVFMNPEAERLLGWAEMELAGKNIHRAIHYQKADGSFHSEAECPVAAIRGRGEIYRTEDDIFVRKGGEVFPVSYVATPIMEDGEVVASVIAFRDITERKRAEEQIRESRQQLRQLSASLQTLREEERTRIARELHDELGQVLTALKMDLSWMRARFTGDQAELSLQAESMAKMIDATVLAVRRIASDLRPWLLDELGLGAAIEWLLEDFGKRSGIEYTLRRSHDEFDFDGRCATAVFRILQESLTNVARHAQASKVAVALLDTGDEIVLSIKDNGKGMDANADKKSGISYGLVGIRERAYALGGELKMESSPGQGTLVEVTIPKAALKEERPEK